ncbi:MAG: hypothetical protein LH609_07430 [Rudanella sp.]|nr:hypothetical protein [Rudanella sp.]
MKNQLLIILLLLVRGATAQSVVLRPDRVFDGVQMHEDLVAVEGNPVQAINSVRNVRMVMKGGRIVTD